MNCPIIPIAESIVIQRVDEAEQQTPGGILLPEKREDRLKKGRVVAVGPGRWLENGTRGTPECEVGDLVYFDPKVQNKVIEGGEEWLILSEVNLACRLKT